MSRIRSARRRSPERRHCPARSPTPAVRSTVRACGCSRPSRPRTTSTRCGPRWATTLTYLGYSYGTLLGAVYARLYPTNIRAMVLDGAVDPQQSPIASSEGQAKGFERAFANFVNWCAQNAGTACPIAPDARAWCRAPCARPARRRCATMTGGRRPRWLESSTASSRRSMPRRHGRCSPAGSPTSVRATLR